MRFLFVFLVPLTIFCQTEKQTYYSVSYGQGVVLPEYSFVNSLANRPLNQVCLSWYQQSLGTNFWQTIYHYPKVGVSFLFTTLGNKKVFGEELAIYPFFCLKSIDKVRFTLEHQIGLGFGFATKKFDLASNYQNIAVGSHLNLHFHYALMAQMKLSSRLYAGLGFTFDHFSNANLHEPNLGLNMTAFQVQGAYRIQKNEFSKKIMEIPMLNAKNEWAFIYAAGGKHTRALQSTIYFTSSLSAEYKRILGHKFRLGLGLDLFYDSSTKVEMAAANKELYQSQFDYRSGIHFAQEFVYNRFSLILQEGVYVGLTNHVTSSVMYNRMIMRYKWSEHFFTHIAMKSHLHILDYPELGFAYYLKK